MRQFIHPLRFLIRLACTLFTLLVDVVRFLRLCLRPSPALAAENLFLRKQLALYQEHHLKPQRATNTVRLALVGLGRWFDWRQALAVVQPATFLRWHRQGFQLFWRWTSRPGRPPIPADLQTLIRRLAQDNPMWGEERIANELLLKLTARDDPHAQLFEDYQETLTALGEGGEPSPVLRRFEMSLLRELGYAVILDRDVERDEPVARERDYVYVVEHGPVRAAGAPRNGVELSGQTLVDLQSGVFTSAATQQQSKLLMRTLINHCLGNQVLHTRQLLRDLQEL